MRRRNSRRELVRMPMAKRRQGWQRRAIRPGIDRNIKVGLVIIFVSGGKPGPNIPCGVGSPRRKRSQSGEIEVVRPAAHIRGRQFALNHLSLDADERQFGIGEPGGKLGQGIRQIRRAIGGAIGDCMRGHLIRGGRIERIRVEAPRAELLAQPLACQRICAPVK